MSGAIQQGGYQQQGPGLYQQGTPYRPAPPQFQDPPPPPYYGATAAPPQHHAVNNVTVVQPSVGVIQGVRPAVPGDHYLTLSAILTVVCCLCLTWPALICTIAAMIFASAARDAEGQGNNSAVRTNANAALGCNIAALGYWGLNFVGGIIYIILWQEHVIHVGSTVCQHYDSIDNTYTYYYC